MKPIKFKEHNCVYAKDQPEYIQLPAFKSKDDKGTVIFCIGMSFKERLRVLFTGKIWCSLLTFNNPLTPSHFTTKKSDYFIKIKIKKNDNTTRNDSGSEKLKQTSNR